jgi:antitoxin YefM
VQRRITLGTRRVKGYSVQHPVHTRDRSKQSLTTTELRTKLKDVLDRVNDDDEPVAIGRSGGRVVVILDAEDYASIVETLHLVRHPANAERLRRGMAQHQAREAVEIDVGPCLD